MIKINGFTIKILSDSYVMVLGPGITFSGSLDNIIDMFFDIS